MATPMGLVPTVTSGTARAPFKRSTMDAVPAPLLATTAFPRCELTATPWGVAPTAIVLIILPKLTFAGSGLMSIIERLLHPLFVTAAMGESAKVEFPNWSAMATELGLGVAQATFMSTALTARKSVGLDVTPALTTSNA